MKQYPKSFKSYEDYINYLRCLGKVKADIVGLAYVYFQRIYGSFVPSPQETTYCTPINIRKIRNYKYPLLLSNNPSLGFWSIKDTSSIDKQEIGGGYLYGFIADPSDVLIKNIVL